MRILVVGGDGMLGHQLLKTLSDRHEIRVTLRQEFPVYKSYALFNKENSYTGIDIRRSDDLASILADYHPEAVINAVGIVKQRQDAKAAIPSLEINSLFPHRLAILCKSINARMVHISTDCIFSGNKGTYTEDDLSDAEDLYGKTKFLGEVTLPHCITIRSSIIGLELSRKTSLIEWFLAQKGEVKGFRRAIYTGLTTPEMARLIEKVLLEYKDLSGVWHVGSEPINKYDLLTLFSEKLNRSDVAIYPDDNFVCDRSMLSTRFQGATGYQAPAWPQMIEELAKQVKLRSNNYVV